MQRVRQFVRQHGLFRAETRVVVALSGGSDSVALALILRELDASGEVRLAGAAHFNHQLRDHAQRDEQFSASVARSLEVPFVADREDVGARARRGRRSLEDAAREARYEFFERARQQFGADVVALGHTRDDQAETFLLRLLRGAGPRGLAAMYPQHGTIIRPVLDCRREELRTYLNEREMTYVEDETNDDIDIPRNRIRAELLPLLVDRFNPAIVDVLANEAELARETWAWLESVASDFEKGVEKGVRPLFSEGEEKGPYPFFEVERLLAAPPPLRRLVLWRAMNAAAGGRSVSFEHVAAALHLLNADSGAVDAPGHRVERIGSRVVLTGRRNREHLVNLFQYPLSIPGEVQLAESGCIVAAELETGPAGAKAAVRSGRGPLALVRRDLFQGPLAVRNRRPGDKFRPVGLGGRKKLQDYFVDRKVALGRRDRVPLVVDGSDRIVWVAGFGIDEAFRVTDPSQSMLLLRLKVVGGSA
ncbi:MAG TPA: tRNA lysidine(34) synthetase TilS [Vicinamibacterales bacterium]